MAKRGSLSKVLIGILIGMSLLLTGCGMESIDTIMQYFSVDNQYEAEIEQVGKIVTKEELDQQIESIEQEEAVASSTDIVFCTYAYEQLQEEEQLWYQDIKRILENMEIDKELSSEGIAAGLDEKNIDKIFQCVLLDNPEYFYVEGYNYTKYTRLDKLVKIEFSGNYSISHDEMLQRKDQIEQEANKILMNISMEASDYEKALYVYEKIILQTDYDLQAIDNQNIYSVFVGQASVCQGYAKATQYLLNRLGVECCLVLGEVEGGEGHAWNLVKLDGEYYYMDTTWGDASYRMEDEVEIVSPYPLPEINYDYLNVTTEQLLKTHTLDHIVPLPDCTSTKNNYYVKEGCMFTEYNETMLTTLFENNLSLGKTDVTIKCSTESVYRLLKDRLIEQQQIFNFLGTEYNSVAYAENDKQLSLTFWMTNG